MQDIQGILTVETDSMVKDTITNDMSMLYYEDFGHVIALINGRE